MVLYGLKNCDTCRKALNELTDTDFLDVREDGVPTGVLNSAYDTFGAAILNTRSTTWRRLNDAERARDPLELLAAHPTLMKRPLIEDGGRLYLGWTKDVQAALLG